jgi:hypothetical protein
VDRGGSERVPLFSTVLVGIMIIVGMLLFARLMQRLGDLQIGNWSACHPAFGGGLRHRGRHDFDQPLIKWLRDKVLTTKAEPCVLVGQGDRFGYFGVGKFGKRMDGGELHSFIASSIVVAPQSSAPRK